MRICVHAAHNSLLVFACVLRLVSLGVCEFDRGDRYWNGRPQPIGIDLTSGYAIAVYADGPVNFTTLGAAVPKAGNQYAEFMDVAFRARDSWDEDAVFLNDDDQIPVDSWLDEMSHWLSSRASALKRDFILAATCDKLLSRILTTDLYHETCHPREDVPQRPKSKYRQLHAQSRRTRRLRSMFPKWFRTPPQSRSLTRSAFILSIAELLEDLKAGVRKDHDIEINSATISRPHWMFNDKSDMIDEACLLAGIELFEQPPERVEMAAKTATSGAALMVLDHGPFHLEIVNMTWDYDRKAHAQRGGRSQDHFGTNQYWIDMTFHILSQFAPNATDARGLWYEMADIRTVVNDIAKTSWNITHGRHWPKDLEFGNRSIAITVMTSTGLPRVLNVTGQGTLDVERAYVDVLSHDLKHQLFDWDALLTNREANANYEEFKELPYDKQLAKEAVITAHRPSPAGAEPWIKHIDEVVVVGDGPLSELLWTAVYEGLGESFLEKRVCIPNNEIAARGAALRAREWGGYYEASGFGGSWRWDVDYDMWVDWEKGYPLWEQVRDVDVDERRALSEEI